MPSQRVKLWLATLPRLQKHYIGCERWGHRLTRTRTGGRHGAGQIENMEA